MPRSRTQAIVLGGHATGRRCAGRRSGESAGFTEREEPFCYGGSVDRPIRWTALALALAGCTSQIIDYDARVHPDEIFLDFGHVLVGETAERSFALDLSAPEGWNVMAKLETDRPGWLSIIPSETSLRPGSNAFTARVSPRDGPGEMLASLVLDLGIASPYRVDVHVRAVAVVPRPWEPSGCVHLGEVTIGEAGTMSVEIPNPTSIERTVSLSVDAPAFTVDPPEVTIVPFGSASADVGFRPSAEGDHEGGLLLGFCEECAPFRWCLRGTGAPE